MTTKDRVLEKLKIPEDSELFEESLLNQAIDLTIEDCEKDKETLLNSITKYRKLAVNRQEKLENERNRIRKEVEKSTIPEWAKKTVLKILKEAKE